MTATPNRWLVKSEPSSWSWQDQMGVESEPWTGVRNHQAANFLRSMRPGDTVFFYHSVQEKRIVGIARVVSDPYPDPTDPDGRWTVVDLKAMRPFERPVTLAEIKADPRLADLPLIRQSRLSVMPIDETRWKILCDLGGVGS